MTTAQAIPKQAPPDTARVRALPIVDNGETLVAASLAPERILVRPRYHLEGLPGALPECFVRESVLRRLLHAAGELPLDHRLVIFDAWRPLSLQQWLFDRCADEHEDASVNDRNIDAFVSRPMPNPQSNPPYHLTGGAVDLSIADSSGLLLDMGTDFDAMIEQSRTAYFETLTYDTARTAMIRANRRLLYHVMINAGFVNLASEWWHYDYGDQLWAWIDNQAQAIYGASAPGFRWGKLP